MLRKGYADHSGWFADQTEIRLTVQIDEDDRYLRSLGEYCTDLKIERHIRRLAELAAQFSPSYHAYTPDEFNVVNDEVNTGKRALMGASWWFCESHLDTRMIVRAEERGGPGDVYIEMKISL